MSMCLRDFCKRREFFRITEIIRLTDNIPFLLSFKEFDNLSMGRDLAIKPCHALYVRFCYFAFVRVSVLVMDVGGVPVSWGGVLKTYLSQTELK